MDADWEATWMAEALAEARAAVATGDVPVGAVVVGPEGLLGRGRNRRQADADPTAHAEILALRAAAQARGSWHLEDSTLVVTLEPCPMCAGAAVAARIGRIVFGAWDDKMGACGSVWDLTRDRRLNHRPQVSGGVAADEAGRLLRDFFQARRPT